MLFRSIIAAFVVTLLHFLILYRLRVPVKWGQMLGAMIAAMSVQWTVARAVANGLITEHLPFARTSKGGLSRMSIEFQAFWEAVIGVLLLIGAVVLVIRNNTNQVREIYIFAGVLVLESLPFLSAVAIAILEISRINSFKFWHDAGVRTALSRQNANALIRDCSRMAIATADRNGRLSSTSTPAKI